MIIDANNLIVGRLASFAAKRAMLGESVVVVNCEEAVMTGRRRNVIEKYKRKRTIGNVIKGPFYPRMPDRLIRRIIRGMLPHKQNRGATAFRRVQCYIGMPDEYKNQKIETLKFAEVSKVKDIGYIKIKEVVKELGVKI